MICVVRAVGEEIDARDAAEAEMLRASYTERVARANLDFAVGTTEVSVP